MHEHNPIENVLGIGVLIGVVLILLWGTTFAAQAITGKRLIQHGMGFGAVVGSHNSHTVTVPSQ